MTTIQEEDDLFGASLSLDFYQSASTTPSRPWKSSQPPSTSQLESHSNDQRISSATAEKYNNKYREPYELLDDVPPASSISNNNFHTHNQRSSMTTTSSNRYSVEELYPTVDTYGNGHTTATTSDDKYSSYASRSSSHSRYALDNNNDNKSRYPIDDSSDVESHNDNQEEISIVESRSDSEISDYQPMNNDNDSDEEDGRDIKYEQDHEEDVKKSRYVYGDGSSQDCKMKNANEEDGRSKISSKQSEQESVSSFDRLYNDELIEMEEDNVYSSPTELSHSPKSQDAITPQRSNPHRDVTQRSILDSPYSEAPTPASSPGSSALTQSPTSGVSYSSASVSPALPPTPPQRPRVVHRTNSSVASSNNDIFQIHGTDSCLSSKSSGTGLRIHDGNSSVGDDDNSSVGMSSSIVSNDSAIQHLVSFQEQQEQTRAEDSNSSGDRKEEEQQKYDPSTDDYSYTPQVVKPRTTSSSYYGIKTTTTYYKSQYEQQRQDPPTDDIGCYPQNEHAQEPEGYRQDGLFPDIDLSPPRTTSAAVRSETNDDRAETRGRVTVKEETNQYYEPEYYEDDQQEEEKLNSESRYYEIDDDDLMVDDYYEPSYGGGVGMDAVGYKSNDGQLELIETYHTTSTTTNDEDDKMRVMTDSGDGKDSSSNEEESSYKDNADDSISIISDDDIRNLASQQQDNTKKHKLSQSPKSPSYYQIKQKDSMESDIDASKNKKDTKEIKQQQRRHHVETGTYVDIKRNDSMEQNMSIESDDDNDYYFNQVENTAVVNEEREDVDQNEIEPQLDTTVLSPPNVERRAFSFDYPDDEGGRYEDNMAAHRLDDDHQRRRSIVSEEASYSSSDDESEASDDPTLFPSKAISQMNLVHHHDDDNDIEHESEDLVEQACHHLSTGRNDKALDILNEALKIAQANVTNVKSKMDYFYFQKKRRGNQQMEEDELIEEEEMEDRLDTHLRDSSSEVANVINNIGVVYEMKGEYQRAMKSFREALDVYRNQCHRYENAGDGDVDRTVNNIMQMGIAMESHDKRQDLHNEEAELAAQTRRWNHSNNQGLCTQLRMARLNLLMCVLDIETESLGKDHPAVGFTLLKKGSLHLEMVHVDMAIKDTRDAVEILKIGLGGIHPEVGLALIRLGDIYNYHLGRYGDNQNVALSLYEEALTPLRSSFGKTSPHLGIAYNCIGILNSSMGDTKHALTSFYDALASFGVRSRADIEASSKKKGSHHHSSRPDVFFVWINVGGLHMMNQEWQLALRSYLKAHSAFNCLEEEEKMRLTKIAPRRLMKHALSLSKGQSSFSDNDTLIASILQNIGKAQSMSQHYGKAIETLREALRIHQVVAIRNGSKSSTQDVARILENLGEVEMISGDLTSAFDHYVESLNLLRSCKQVDDLSIEVALVLGAIGQVHQKKGEYNEAVVILKECMWTFEKLGVPQTNHRINEIRSSLVDSELELMQSATATLAGQRREISSVPYDDKALAIDEIADAYKNKGDSSGAIWFYTEALSIRRQRVDERLLSSGRRDSNELVDIGKTLSNIAQLRRERREFGAAKILFDEARKLYRSIGVSSDHPFYRDLMLQIEIMRKT